MKREGKLGISLATAALMLFSLSAGVPEKTIRAEAAGKRIEINETNFPDPMFRYLISTGEYDRNGDGYIDQDEIALTINIRCEYMGIKSLKGIEYFTDLQGLYCSYNDIASVDLSKNKELRGIWCDNNEFTSLDFTPNPKLLWVYCYQCKISSLNIANNPDMAYVECNDNPLHTLNVSNNTKLEHLICNYCELTSLNLDNNRKLTHLDAIGNHFTTLNLKNNTKLKRLDIWDNHELGSVDIRNNKELQYYNCSFNGADRIDVSQNRELQKLSCAYNSITSLDLSNNPKLVYLDCACNGITSLDLSNNPKIYFLQAFTNAFTKLNIGDNRILVKTYNEGVNKAEYQVCQGHSWTIDYGIDDSTQGDQKCFLCFDDAVELTMTPTKPVQDISTYSEDNITDTSVLLTREAAVQTLYAMAGKPSVSGLTTRFTDVKRGSDYEKAILWGEKYNICTGFPDIFSNTFGVGKWVTRQDLALMLMRYSEVMGYKRAIDFGRSDDYIDYFDIDYYAWEAITWSATWDIMAGKGAPGAPKEEQRIDPHGRATRTEFKAMLKRLLEVNNATNVTIPEIPANVNTGNDPSPSPSGPRTKYGDLDSDGDIDNWDLALMQQYVSEWSVNIDKIAADVNGDNMIDTADISLMQQYLSDWNVTLGRRTR